MTDEKNNSKPTGNAMRGPFYVVDSSVAEAAGQLASIKLFEQDDDEWEDDDDTTARTHSLSRPKEDPDLWKPSPPPEDCPVCLVPLPPGSTFFPCCGKRVCRACEEEGSRALEIMNEKREKKELPPLRPTCAFCRSLVHENNEELIERFEERVRKGDSRAMLNLAKKYREGHDGLAKDTAKAMELFHKAADSGSIEAVGELGYMYCSGIAPVKDMEKGRQLLEKAAKGGDLCSRYNLATFWARNGQHYVAIKHLKVAAAAGDEVSMKRLWFYFSDGALAKTELEECLRAHKDACDDMNSEERERYRAGQKALAGDDEILKQIYSSYYLGHSSAKELKKELKAYQVGK